jgi:hypothetical protein
VLRAFKLPPPQLREMPRNPALIEAPVFHPAPQPPAPRPPQFIPAPPPVVATGVLDSARPSAASAPPPQVVKDAGFASHLQNEPKLARATVQPTGFDGGLAGKLPDEPRPPRLAAAPDGFDTTAK